MSFLSILSATLLTASSVSIQFDGTLKDAISEIAKKGELNVIVSGDMNESVHIQFQDIAPDQALMAVSESYGLVATQNGKTWTIRRHELAAGPPVPGAIDPPTDLSKVKKQALAVRDRLKEHLVSTGEPVVVKAGTRVESAVAYGASVIIEDEAVVEGDAVAFGGNVELGKDAMVEGDAVAFGGTVVREDGSVVEGESVSFGGKDLGAVVARGLTHGKHIGRISINAHDDNHDGDHKRDDDEADDTSSGIAAFLLQFCVLFGLGFLAMMFLPARMKIIESSIRSDPGKNAAVGFLALIASLPLTLLLVITIIGIPVALVGWLAAMVIVPVGLSAVANAIGIAIPTGRWTKTQALALAIGTLLMLLVARIPGIGPIAMTVALFIAIGSIVRTRLGRPYGDPPNVEHLGAAPAM